MVRRAVLSFGFMILAAPPGAFGQADPPKDQDKAEVSRPGDTHFLFTGFATAGFTDQAHGPSTFYADFNPIFLWEPTPDLLFESEVDFVLEGDVTSVELDYAQLSYLANDYVTLGAGKFLLPFGTFAERLHPSWINKLPDRPLPFDEEEGISPETGLGVQVRGAFPAGETKFNYAFYAANGPALDAGDDDPAEAGRLRFDNFTDIDDNKAVGGRVGILPIPELEIGYSFQVADVNASGTSRRTAGVTLHSVDFTYAADVEPLAGRIDARIQWVWSDVERLTYDPDGSLGFGPVTYDNRRDGGYAQVAYRPSDAESEFLADLEFVVRYDRMSLPSGAPTSTDESRWTVGVNYWLASTSAIKVAYAFDDRSGERDGNALMFQWAFGF